MSRLKGSLDHKRIRRLVWLVLTVFVLLVYSLQSVAGSAYYSMLMQAYGTVSSPPVILEEGNVTGASTIYANKTSAKVSVVAPVWLSGWDKRVKITIDSNDVDSALSNFPVLIYLSSSSGRDNDNVTFVFDEVGSNSKKIAATTSDGTQCYVEIEKWDDASEQAWLWVKVPSISDTSDTDLYLYYDNGQPDNTDYVGDPNSTPAENVWDTNFKGVWHMTEVNATDSTSNNNDGTESGGVTYTDSGKIDGADDFDGANDYVSISADLAQWLGKTASLSVWIRTTQTGNDVFWSAPSVTGVEENGGGNDVFWGWIDASGRIGIQAGDTAGAKTTSAINDGNWHHIFMTRTSSSGEVKIYADGILNDTATSDTGDKTNSFYSIGRIEDTGGTPEYFNGTIDEVRISNTTRSAAWIKASYESERDDLLDFGPEDYVDNNTSNVGFPTDKGTHSNFAAQQSGPDSIYDTLTEENIGEGEAIEDYVDNNTSDVDNSTDSGSHSNFENQKAKDLSYDTLTEDGGTKNWGQNSQLGSATSVGPYRYIGGTSPNLQGMTITKVHVYIATAGTIAIGVWTGGALDNPVGATKRTESYDVSVVVGWNELDFPDYSWPANTVTWIGWTNDGTSQVVYSSSSGDSGDFQSARGRWSQTSPDPANASVSMPSTIGVGAFSDYWYSMYIEYDAPYQLDLEVQFTDVIDFLPTETLCIYAGTLGAEYLNVDFWNGTGWENLATDLTANSWNNYTVSLTSTTFTVRFKDGTIVGDTATQDQWQIDVSLLRVGGAGSKEDAVDNDMSDVDSSADLGNLVNFDNMKAIDSAYANLTESAEGITYINVAEASATSGTSAQVNKPTGTTEDDFMIALLVSTISFDTDGSTMFSAPSGWTNEYDYIQRATSGQHVYIYWKVAGASEPSSYTWTWTSSCGWVAQITTFRGVDTGSPIHVEGTLNQESSSSPMSPSVTTTEDNCVIWLYDMCDDDDVPAGGGAPSGTTWIDQTEIASPGDGVGISTAYFVQASAGATGNRDWTLDAIEENSGQQYALKPVPANYQLDQEVQWTNVPHLLPNENLSIYGGSMGTEDIKVDVWNGTDWETVFADLSSGWNNASITNWLTSSNFTIRFKGGTETSDTNEDTWQIDVALIHVWNDLQDNYELDLEVQWTNADYDETNEKLCIYYYEGNTYSLDATGGYMIIGDGTPDWGSTTGTISFWVKMDASVQGRFWGQDGNMETRWSGTNLLLDWGATGSMTSATSFSADTWYFVAIVWDENNDNLFLYVGDENNVPTLDANSLSGTWTSTTPAPTENRFMNGLGGNEPVDGHGDDLRYWNIARSLTEIQSDYNTELIGSETNLRSYFKLNNNFDDIGPDNNDGSGSGSYSFSSDVSFEAPPIENIRVDVWNGTTWQNLFADLTNGWNNVSVSSYLNSSTFTIRFKGGNETSDTTQDSWYIDATLLHVWTTETYDYVLKIVNQVADNWTINLQVYNSSNIGRLSSLNISLHDGTSSNQIAVSGGSIVKSEGDAYNLPGGLGSTIYISMSNLKATTTGTSYLYAYLKLLVPNSSTYILYFITFEIT